MPTKNMITPYARLSYPALLEPKPKPNSTELVYSCSLVFPPEANLAELRAAADAAGEDKFGAERWRQLKAAGKVRLPFREDGDDKGYPEGTVFVNCSARTKPGLVDQRLQSIHTEDVLYPGCWVRASVNFFGYDSNGNKGVGVGLNNVQKVKDDTRFDGRRAADQEFSAIEDAELADAHSLM